MEPLQHDPRTKSQIKEALYDALYAPVHDHFKKRLDAIILKNTSLIGSSHHSFTYKGEYFSSEDTRPPRRLNRLVPQLRATMDEYLRDVRELNEQEIPYVIGFITQVLNLSNSLQDYLAVLPESVHDPIKNLIDTCPCCHRKITDTDAQQFRAQNQAIIDLIKQRMVRNLIL